MATVLLVLVVVLVIAGLVFGVVTLLSGEDPGLGAVEPDGRALPLPNNRSLTEMDLKTVRFDVELRGYRMAQVDRVLRRTAYDIGYKDEMIAVLEAEVTALREGRVEDAELLRKARESAATPPAPTAAAGGAHGAADSGAEAEADGADEADGSQDEEDADPIERRTDDEDRLRDIQHRETEDRLEEDGDIPLTEDPKQQPAGEADIPEEQAPRG